MTQSHGSLIAVILKGNILIFNCLGMFSCSA